MLNITYGQKYNKDNIALCYFTVMADEGLGLTVDKAMENSVYDRVTKILADTAGISLKPVDFLKGKVAYDFYDYPLVGGKKAAKSNLADNYLRICINIDRTGIQSTSENSSTISGVTVGSSKIKVKVRVKMNIEVFDKTGTAIIDETYVSKSKNEIEFESKDIKVGNFSSSTYKHNDESTFQGLLDICSVSLANKLK